MENCFIHYFRGTSGKERGFDSPLYILDFFEMKKCRGLIFSKGDFLWEPSPKLVIKLQWTLGYIVIENLIGSAVSRIIQTNRHTSYYFYMRIEIKKFETEIKETNKSIVHFLKKVKQG